MLRIIKIKLILIVGYADKWIKRNLNFSGFLINHRSYSNANFTHSAHNILVFTLNSLNIGTKVGRIYSITVRCDGTVCSTSLMPHQSEGWSLKERLPTFAWWWQTLVAKRVIILAAQPAALIACLDVMLLQGERISEIGGQQQFRKEAIYCKLLFKSYLLNRQIDFKSLNSFETTYSRNLIIAKAAYPRAIMLIKYFLKAVWINKAAKCSFLFISRIAFLFLRISLFCCICGIR